MNEQRRETVPTSPTDQFYLEREKLRQMNRTLEVMQELIAKQAAKVAHLEAIQ